MEGHATDRDAPGRAAADRAAADRDAALRDADARPGLRRLADRLGIVPEYVDQSGTERRETSDETRMALLRAMGFPASTEDEAWEALARLERDEARRLVEPTRVVRADQLADERARLCIPIEATGRVAWLLTLETEDGATAASEGEVDAEMGELVLPLPASPEIGYHALHALVSWNGNTREAMQRLIVVPDCCWLPGGGEDARDGAHDEAGDAHDAAHDVRDEARGEPRYVGLTVNLYTVRSADDWGIGNLGDLAALMEWGASVGADFVGVSPLHALWNRGTEVSPYSPVSRLYRNPLYLDVEAIPELAESAEARTWLAEPEVQRELRALRESARVEYARIRELQRPLLEALHRTFVERHRGRDTERGRAYAEYLENEGQPLVDFATFLVLDEVQAAERGHPDWFRRWPSAYQGARTSEVALFREAHAERVDFHCWLQFELDRQLGEAARAGREAGMRIGLYPDLAIGTSGGGSDAWAYPQLLLQGVSVGAPPDLLGPQGQDWGLPPLDPRRLREDGYAYWVQLLQSAFAHAGALRIDHILGLFRQFWIPHGMGAANGAYVRFPSEDMLGILALESHRHRAVVVGEDLGTVPPEVPPTLRRWGVLSSRVLYFEQDADGHFHPSAAYEPHALATANTHDMAPLAGWQQGRELVRRHEAGMMDEAELARQLDERARTVRRLRERLAAEGALPSVDADVTDAGFAGAVHRFLRRSPSMLVGLSLDDLVGEEEPVNMPGLQPEQFPSWTRRMRLSVEELRDDPEVRTALGDAALGDAAAAGRR
ncbi:MAG TPA: 4-alpha-glucanotransferase [Gemmatimonadaceae bacterium]|nr:4-alpha-glucanotransferase [Gemmatimonadaceae bacterium]